MSRALQIVNIGGIDDNRFVLGNAHIARKLDLTPHIALPHNWVRIRMAYRLAFDDFGSNILDTPRFSFGLMSDPAAGMPNGMLTDNASHCVGPITKSITWSRFANSGFPFYNSTYNLHKRVGSTTTNTSFGSGTGLLSASVNSRRFVHLAEFTRSGGNLVVAFYVPTASVDKTESVLLEGLSRATVEGAATTIGDIGLLGGGTRSIAIDEATDGFLNSIFFAWDRVSPKFYLSECFYSVFAS